MTGPVDVAGRLEGQPRPDGVDLGVFKEGEYTEPLDHLSQHERDTVKLAPDVRAGERLVRTDVFLAADAESELRSFQERAEYQLRVLNNHDVR